MSRLVVIGGNAAGMSAASKAKRVNPNLEVVVLEKTNHVSYAPCGVPLYLSGEVGSIDELIHMPARIFREKRGIDVRLRSEAVDVDSSAKTVTVVEKETGREYTLEYDKLVIATGAKPLIPRIPGVDSEGIYTIRNVEDGEKFKRALSEAEVLGVVGGGYVGLEVAEAVAKLGKKVVVFEMLPHVLPNFDPEISSLVEEELKRNGVEIKTSEAVREFSGGEGSLRVSTDNGEYKVDLVLLAVGVRPNVDLASRAGVELGPTGAVRVNEKMETSVPNVYSAGDNTETVHVVTGKPTYIPLAPAANKMGRVAGANAAGGHARFPGVAGTAGLKIFSLEVARTGLSEAEAKREGFDVASATIEAGTRSGYYPGARRVKVKLIADRETGRLLGAQIAGPEGAAGRINTVAAALTFRAKVEDLAMMDLVYHPAFAPVWDPLIVAANVLMRSLS